MSLPRRTVTFMPTDDLPPAKLLGVAISAALTRNKFTQNPTPVIHEIRHMAGDRTDVLAYEVGVWVGWHEHDVDVRVLWDALSHAPGIAEWVALGRARRAAGSHKNPE